MWKLNTDGSYRWIDPADQRKAREEQQRAWLQSLNKAKASRRR